MYCIDSTFALHRVFTCRLRLCHSHTVYRREVRKGDREGPLPIYCIRVRVVWSYLYTMLMVNIKRRKYDV